MFMVEVQTDSKTSNGESECQSQRNVRRNMSMWLGGWDRKSWRERTMSRGTADVIAPSRHVIWGTARAHSALAVATPRDLVESHNSRRHNFLSGMLDSRSKFTPHYVLFHRNQEKPRSSRSGMGYGDRPSTPTRRVSEEKQVFSRNLQRTF